MLVHRPWDVPEAPTAQGGPVGLTAAPTSSDFHRLSLETPMCARGPGQRPRLMSVMVTVPCLLFLVSCITTFFIWSGRQSRTHQADLDSHGSSFSNTIATCCQKTSTVLALKSPAPRPSPPNPIRMPLLLLTPTKKHQALLLSSSYYSQLFSCVRISNPAITHSLLSWI